MSDFASNPPSKGAKQEQPDTFKGGMMPVPDVLGYYVIDLRALKLDKEQSLRMHKVIHESVVNAIGEFGISPKEGIRELSGHLAGMYIEPI